MVYQNRIFKSNTKDINPALGSGSSLFQASMNSTHQASSECIYSTITIFHGSGDSGSERKATKPQFRVAVSLCSGGSLGSGAMEAVEEEEWMNSGSGGAPTCNIHVATLTCICLPTDFQ